MPLPAVFADSARRSVLAQALLARHWNRVLAVGAGLQRRRRINSQLLEPRRHPLVAVQRGLERDLLAGMRGHAAHIACDARLDASLRLVVGLVLPDRLDQLVPLVLVWVAVVLRLPGHLGGVDCSAAVDAGRPAAIRVA